MIQRKPDLLDNHAMDTDSYKWSHWNQYPDFTTRMMSYFESRGGEFPTTTLFGLQYVLHRFLSKPLLVEDVVVAQAFAQDHGEPFNTEGWMTIVNKHDGRLPVRIRAIPEGLIVPPRNVLMTIESTDPECFWLANVLETPLVRIWAGSTVASASRESKKILYKFLEKTGENPDAEIGFKLHDFGSRGVTCKEQARIAGAAHLLSFLGSDTLEGIRMANHYYDSVMAGFSIPASEHSTVTMWGKDGEFEMVEKYIQTYLIDRKVPDGMPKLAACVGDSWDIYEFTRRVTTGHLKEMIKSSGGTFVIRPDSGNPVVVQSLVLGELKKTLKDEIRVNEKGYKVLPDWLRIIQGDGIDIKSMEKILERFEQIGWSTSNIAFGSGGGLLQRWNRDTQQWAFKCSAAMVDGKWIDVRKDPVTDHGKHSKAGRLDLIESRDGNGYETVRLIGEEEAHPQSVMNTVFENGKILYNTTFDECRARMAL